MESEQVDRRTLHEGRARFAEYKAGVASCLPRVAQRMPEPWFDELCCQVARLKIRVGAPPMPTEMVDQATGALQYSPALDQRREQTLA